MKLIVVERTKTGAFRELREKFADSAHVKVIYDRRVRQIRLRQETRDPERRKAERRRLSKDWRGRDYFAVDVVDA